MICCETFENLGYLDACEPINFGIASNVGDYVLLLEFNGGVKKFTQSLNIGDNVVFEVLTLNENYYYKAKLIAPDASFTCYEFNTYYSA
jgi:hypothetical protein